MIYEVTLTLKFQVDSELWAQAYGDPEDETEQGIREYFGQGVEVAGMLPPAADEWLADRDDQRPIEVKVRKAKQPVS